MAEMPHLPRLLLALLAATWLRAADPPADPMPYTDAAILKGAGIADDGPALLDFFRKRTLTPGDRDTVAGLIRQLGSETFDDREKASKRLPPYGTAILPALREAAKDEDPERSRRAREAAERIEAAAVSGLPGAVARSLARKKVAGATAVLLAYLPFADDLGVEDEIVGVLLTLNAPKELADPSLAAALDDAHPAIRGAAAQVLGRRGNDGARKLLADREPRVRYRAAVGLIAARDRGAVPPLINLLGEEVGPLAWQVEEILFRIAGEKSPAVSVGAGGAEARVKARDAWRAWWKENGAEADLGLVEAGERLIGLTLGIEYNTGRVWECGPDGTPRWEIKGLQGPMEAQVLPGNRVLIAESNNKTISERDFQGKVLWKKVLPNEPSGVQRLPNGNTFVSTYTSVMEFDRDGKTVYEVSLPGGGSNAIRKARNGNVICAYDGEIVELDTKGTKVRSVPLPKQSMWVGIRDLPGDRFLVCNSTTGQVIEVDAAGKVLWGDGVRVAGACGLAKLPNGHVLVGAPNRIVELDRAGKEVWETRCPGYVRRVHRR